MDPVLAQPREHHLHAVVAAAGQLQRPERVDGLAALALAPVLLCGRRGSLAPRDDGLELRAARSDGQPVTVTRGDPELEGRVGRRLARR